MPPKKRPPQPKKKRRRVKRPPLLSKAGREFEAKLDQTVTQEINDFKKQPREKVQAMLLSLSKVESKTIGKLNRPGTPAPLAQSTSPIKSAVEGKNEDLKIIQEQGGKKSPQKKRKYTLRCTRTGCVHDQAEVFP